MVMIFNPSLKECSDIPPRPPKKKVIIAAWKTKTPTEDKEPKCVFAKKVIRSRGISANILPTRFFNFFSPLIPQMITSCQQPSLLSKQTWTCGAIAASLQHLIQTDCITMPQIQWEEGRRGRRRGVSERETNSFFSSAASCPLHVFDESLWKWRPGVKSSWKQTLFTESRGPFADVKLVPPLNQLPAAAWWADLY